MYYQRPKILSYLAKVPILFLYVSFFIVQLFFNFDIENHSNNTTLLFSCKNVAVGHHSSGIEKTNKAKDTKQTIRLNKRFKPQVILAYNRVDIKWQAYSLETKTFVLHSDIFIHASFLLSQSFRGPPFIA